MEIEIETETEAATEAEKQTLLAGSQADASCQPSPAQPSQEEALLSGYPSHSLSLSPGHTPIPSHHSYPAPRTLYQIIIPT